MALTKYKAVRTTFSGYSFASKIEAQRYAELELLKRAGEVVSIKCQVQVSLSHANIIYKPDFLVEMKDGSQIYEEVKGFETPEWRLKRKLWIAYGPGELHIYKLKGRKLYLDEVLKEGKYLDLIAR